MDSENENLKPKPVAVSIVFCNLIQDDPKELQLLAAELASRYGVGTVKVEGARIWGEPLEDKEFGYMQPSILCSKKGCVRETHEDYEGGECEWCGEHCVY